MTAIQEVGVTLVKVPVGGAGAFVEFEVDEDDPGVALLARGEPGVAEAPRSLAAALDRVVPALSAIMSGLQQVEPSPEEITVDLGLKVGGETGLVFAKAAAEGSIAVTVTWRRPSPAGGEGADGP